MTNLSLFQKTRAPHTRPSTAIRQKEHQKNEFGGKILLISASRISPNPAQPRRIFDNDSQIRLADSIRQYGILQPLVVRRTAIGDFEIIAGERRLRAAKLLGMLEVPCIVLDVSERVSAELAIIENVQRENLNMFEQASAIAALIDIYGLTQERAAKRLSLSQSYIANKLRILRLTADEREIILSENLTERHARALLRIDDIEERKDAARYIAARSMNVAQSEEYIEKLIERDFDSGATLFAAEAPSTAKQKIVLSDMRFFYNTLDRAIDIVKRAGVSISSERRECDDKIELTIRIEK